MKNICCLAFPDEAQSAQRLGASLSVPVQFVKTHIFPDGELLPRVSCSTKTAVIYRSLNRPNVKLLELLLTADACRRSGAQRVVLVAPYMAYMRQDTVFSEGEPKSQAVIGALLARAFNRIVTVDPHLHRTHKLSDVFPGADTECLQSADTIARGLADQPLPANTLVVGPDLESSQWVDAIAARTNLDSTVFLKTRYGDRTVSLDLPADLAIANRPIILVDDICSTGATLCAAISRLREGGAGPIELVVTHALFDQATHQQLINAGATRIRSTDSCQHSTNSFYLAPLLATAIEQELEG